MINAAAIVVTNLLIYIFCIICRWLVKTELGRLRKSDQVLRNVLYCVQIIHLISESYCVLTAASLELLWRRLQIIVNAAMINVCRAACGRCILLVIVLKFILGIEFFKNHLVVLIFIWTTVDQFLIFIVEAFHTLDSTLNLAIAALFKNCFCCYRHYNELR